MKIVEVAPIGRGIFKDSLTYFSAKDIAPGALVVVPVGGRKIFALVTAIKPAENLKSELKKTDFSLRKVLSVKCADFFLPGFILACQKTADESAGSLGQILTSLLPKAILENYDELCSRKKTDRSDRKKTTEEESGIIKQSRFVYQENDEERTTYYKSLIRESFAKGQSVFLCLPTIHDIERLAGGFGKGISDYIVILHGGLSKKEQLKNWHQAVESEHPVLLLGTPLFLSTPMPDIGLFIIDKENSSAYKSISRPFLDYRALAERLAQEMRVRILFGDLALRTETIFRAGRGDYAASNGNIKYRATGTAETTIIDAKKAINLETKDILAISPKLENHLKEILGLREKVFIFCGRKGLAPNTVCGDCGTLIICENCGAPLVLHKATKQGRPANIFLCHHCGLSIESDDQCPSCGGWRLRTLGFGIEEMCSALAKMFPDQQILRLDAETVKSPKTAKEIIAKFWQDKKSILLGTEMALYYLDDQVDNVVAVALDSLFSVPDFRLNEKIFRLVLQARDRARKRFIIQTRRPDEKIFDYASKGNLLDFYRDEIAERLQFKYPPFKRLIKITLIGQQETVSKEMTKLGEFLNEWQPAIFASIGGTKTARRMNAIIKIPYDDPLPKELTEKLRSLPPAVIIDVDPENIL